MDYSIISKILFFSLSNSFIIFCWLNTNFFIEYYKLFKIKGLRLADEYIKRNESGFIEIFPDFLKNKDNFLCNLFSCPICLTVWLSIASTFWIFPSTFVVAFFTFIFYFVLKKCFDNMH
jgi:hypothetical protein